MTFQGMCTQPPLDLIFAGLGALRCTYSDKLHSHVPRPLPVIQCCMYTMFILIEYQLKINLMLTYMTSKGHCLLDYEKSLNANFLH